MSEEEWQPMSTAPKNASWVLLKKKGFGNIYRAHFAQDLSGEDQPSFRGWFNEVGKEFHFLGNDNDFSGWKHIA